MELESADVRIAYNGRMRTWNLQSSDPLSLFLAADARLCSPDYTDDQIWELTLRGGDPPAMAVETTLGLRAVDLRLFPVFVVGSRPVHDPADFISPPVVRRFAPNYLSIECAPARGSRRMQRILGAGIPLPLAGRITLRATGGEAVRGELRLAGILRPAVEGACFAGVAAGPLIGTYLRGRTMNFHPVVVLAGASGVGRGAVPSLKTALEADPARPQTVRWAFACRPSAEESLALARVAARAGMGGRDRPHRIDRRIALGNRDRPQGLGRGAGLLANGGGPIDRRADGVSSPCFAGGGPRSRSAVFPCAATAEIIRPDGAGRDCATS